MESPERADYRERDYKNRTISDAISLFDKRDCGLDLVHHTGTIVACSGLVLEEEKAQIGRCNPFGRGVKVGGVERRAQR